MAYGKKCGRGCKCTSCKSKKGGRKIPTPRASSKGQRGNAKPTRAKNPYNGKKRGR